MLKRLSIALTFLLILLILPLYAWKVSEKTDYTDFDVYYRAAERAAHLQWDDLYSLKDGASPFRYAPLFVPLFRPFVALPLSQAKLLWFFIQYACFGFGFYWIFRTLMACRKNPSSTSGLWITSLSLLFILRFCLDTFTIGQVSSLMFLGYCVGLYAWVVRRPAWVSAGLLIPSLFKIGPAALYGVFLSARGRERKKAIWAFASLMVLWGVLFSIWAGSWELIQKLWTNWVQIVANDSVYYDASHYGSQSLNSVLLRMVRQGILSAQHSQWIHTTLSLILCGGLVLFWTFRRPRSLLGRGFFFSLGLFLPIWIMPETFKYSLTPLAIPAALLFSCGSRSRFTQLSLIFGALTLSLAGKDIVGDSLFFGLQHNSIPFIATVLLGIATFREAWRESTQSAFTRHLALALKTGKPSFGPWKELPQAHLDLEVSLLIPLPLQNSSSLDAEFAKKAVLRYQQFLELETDSRFEILIIPYGNRWSEFHPVLKEIKNSVLKLNSIRILSRHGASFSEIDGRGSALRTGFFAAKGKKILLLQLEQPCNTEFFQDALRLLDSGIDLARANRRLPESRFDVPVRSLSLVYSRHRLGLFFNRLIRFLLPIQTTDTHSGNLAISRRLARETFAVQTSPDFLFDLELSLTSVAHGFRERDLPVRLSLSGEKTLQRVFLETISILRGLPILASRYRRNYYHPSREPQRITADDWGLSPGVNRGILQLAKLGVVRRVSLMANCPYLEDGLDELRALKNVELGIHFNLTYGRPSQETPHLQSPLMDQKTPNQGSMIPSPGKFLYHWMNPRADRTANRTHVRAELTSQLAKLRDVGVNTQYLDGHHHIHLVPGLLDEIADLIRAAGIRRVRLPYDASLWRSSKAPLAILSLLVRAKMKRYGFESLPCIYPQEADFRDHGKLRARLAQSPEAEVIVHPAEVNDLETLEFPDSYTNGRIMEFQALRMLRKP
jgi:predicted glycoside hydrolase/deacetylase ChbG (UPF0249 family)